MPWQAKYKFARMSARKIRLMADLIRGHDVQHALNILKFSPNRAAGMVTKVLNSAIANANEGEAKVEQLYVKSTFVNEGPTIKRLRMKDRGRAYQIRKRTSHITVVVDEEKQ